MGEAHFAAAFEAVLTSRPCQIIGVGIERCTFGDVAIEESTRFRAEIRLAAAHAYHLRGVEWIQAQLRQHGNSADARNESDGVLARCGIRQTMLGVRSGAAHSPPRFIEQRWRKSRR